MDSDLDRDSRGGDERGTQVGRLDQSEPRTVLRMRRLESGRHQVNMFCSETKVF